jgi:copper chaperone NosL
MFVEPKPTKTWRRLHPNPAWRPGRRWLVFGLALLGTLTFGLSYFFTYWNFRLVAPQYPQGLLLKVALSGVTGDVKEIDIINHYIGMHHLADAAAIEKAAGPYGVAIIGLSIVVGFLFAGRRIKWGGLVPAVALPLGFLGDTLYWMYSFGHDLDPTAPIEFKPFMPNLLGTGVIGQFRTMAAPGPGFWMAIAGSVLVITAVLMRKNVCASCPVADSCRLHCHGVLGRSPEVRAEKRPSVAA